MSHTESKSVSDEKAGYDAACKRLLSEKIILAWIMKMKSEVSLMCNLSKGVEEKGIEKGRQTGRNKSDGISIKGFTNCRQCNFE